MTTTNWKYADSTNKIVARILEDGHMQSCKVEMIADWIAAGNTPEPADPPSAAELADQQSLMDVASAKQYAKLIALKSMTPAQVDAWVTANINNLADAKDALKTLAIAVSILARRL